MKSGHIDTTDIPPALDWSKAVVGKFHRPIKKPLTIRLDADVLAWLKAQGKGYQTRINALFAKFDGEGPAPISSWLRSRFIGETRFGT